MTLRRISFWNSRCRTDERRSAEWGNNLLRDVLSISWLCFSGRGITEAPTPGNSGGIPSRVFFVKNLPLSSISCRIEDLGAPEDDIVLG
jgi:hypothetical protein